MKYTTRARNCKSVEEPRNRFQAWLAGTTTLFVVPIPGLLKRLQIRTRISSDLGQLKKLTKPLKFKICNICTHGFFSIGQVT
jgi:hypothetical protein